MSSTPPRLPRRAGGVVPRPTRSMVALGALLAYKRGEPRVCAIVRVPSVKEEDHRRIGRERKVLVGERTCHVNRIKGLLFAQGITGYEPLRRA
ncbi:hypothetical protein AJ88_37885 [Mesorhizobium amorphae CCBAU 01583]|nr:hypothetical protein AJ88_37885 [Mesorhizobium amorphae CCBAU 01583]